MSTKVKIETCRFCTEPVRWVEVVIGQRQERQVYVLPIDAEPHVDGRVVEREGAFRLLGGKKRPQAGESTFRLHGRSNCGPGMRRDPR